MSTKYFALLTNIGAAKLAKATALGMQVEITQMAVGDGNDTLPTPDPAQTALAREIRRAPLNVLTVDPLNTSQIIAEQVIPEDVGGWWIREIGLFDKDGDMVAIANCAETYKPQLQEGSGRVQVIRVILIVSSTQAVTLKIDPAVVLATRQYVDSEIIEVKGYVDDKLTEHAQSRNHPDATLTDKGFVQLSSATGSTDETKAATPKAVKAAMDNANKRQPGNENLTALSSLAGQPDKLPYFTNKGAMSLADFAAFMRTMLSKTDAASVLEYLGLKEAAKRSVGTGINQLPDMSKFEFQNDLGGGYVRFPQNWMLQWKKVTIPAASGVTGATVSANYLIPFTSTVISSWANVESRIINVSASPFVCASNNNLSSFLATSTYRSSSLSVMVYSIGR